MKNYNRIKKDNYAIFYYLNDKYHRIDGPAKEWSDGSKEWYLNGLPHRDDGPAYENINGYKAWYKNGLRHRIDGPAIEFADGNECWFYEGKLIDCNSQEEFERYIKLNLFW